MQKYTLKVCFGSSSEEMTSIFQTILLGRKSRTAWVNFTKYPNQRESRKTILSLHFLIDKRKKEKFLKPIQIFVGRNAVSFRAPHLICSKYPQMRSNIFCCFFFVQTMCNFLKSCMHVH